MAPSLNAIRRAFPNLSRAQVAEIRYQMTRPEANIFVDRGMSAINLVLGTHGVERVPRGRDEKSPAIMYCNTGDTYGTTVLYVNESYRIGAWGDIVERGDYE